MELTESKSDLVGVVEGGMDRRAYVVDVLSVLFGIGTWVVVNGLWVELPLLVQTMPEGWDLPTYLTIIVQLANTGPLLYTLLHSLYPKIITETRAIYFVIGLGLTANAFLVFFWDVTGYFLGATRSTTLLGLVFCLAMVDTSSRVMYLPFMARFQSMYLTSFFIGEGLSGFVPSIFAIIQGVGGNPECQWVNVTNGSTTELQYKAVAPPPLFSVEVFFILLFITVSVSLIAFHLLRNKQLTEQALVPESIRPSPSDVLLQRSINEEPPSFYRSTTNDEPTSFDRSTSPTGEQTINNNSVEVKHPPLFLEVSKPTFLYLLAVLAFACALSNGVFPSIQSYSSLPYGNVAYHWSATLSTMANPAVCFLLFVLPPPTKASITSVFVVSLAVGSYVMTTARMSPTPPLVGEISGEALMVTGWVLLVASFTYVKVSIANVLRAEGKRGLFWCGAITQVGSAIGALVMFIIVTQTTLYKSYFITCDPNNVTTTVAPLRNLLV